MKSKSLTIFVACITACAFLSACGDAKASSDKDDNEIQQLLDKTQETSDDTKAEASEKKSAPKKKKQKSEKVEKDEKNIPLPEFCISTQMGSNDTYDQIYIDNTNGGNPELSRELDKLNSDIAAGQESERSIYVRRADRQVFSVACEYRENGEVKTRGRSYLMESGKELELSDIVDVEKAFYDLLARELSAVVTIKMRAYTGDYNMEPVDSSSDMKYRIDRGEYGWVLDPQGVTFWFDSINAFLSNVTVTVLFADDTDGTVFNKDFVSNAPDEWIMQIPGNYSQTCFDREDDGMTDTISWTLSEIEDNEGNQYPSGIDVCINGRNYLSSEIIESYGGGFYGTMAMLVHKDKQTYFMTYYTEEAEPNFVTLSLSDDTVKPADAEYVYIGRDGDGKYVPTDLSAIRVYSDHGGDEMT